MKMKEKSSLKNKKLVLLDAHAIIHRAYHALPDFATSKGEPTGALFGLVSMILKIASDLKPDFIIACYDLPKPTYRHEVYDGYKAGRVKTDDALAIQLEKSKEICEALNIPIYSKEGFEADDILGTIVGKLSDRKGIEIVIASGDMDTLQLVSGSRVRVYTLKKGINDTVLYDEKAVKERFGFGPEFMADYKGLRGDPSDNILGIEGIGEKTATELIINFGTIENIYKKIKSKDPKIKEKIKPRILNLLEEGEEEAKFSKMLATIRRDAPIDFVLPSKRWNEGLDIKKAENLFAMLEFRTMGAKLRNFLNGQKESLSSESLWVSSFTEVDSARLSSDNFPSDLEETKLALWVLNSNVTNPSLEDILFFAKTDSFAEAREKILEEIKNKKEENFVFEQIEKPLIPIIKKMEKRGVLIDKNVIENLYKKYSEELKTIQQKIWSIVGIEFNISSPKQLGEILFDKLGLVLKNQKKTAGGAKSTKESELEKMKEMHPVVPMVLEYRELSKLISTYIEPIPKILDSENRLHAKFIQTGTTTGRMVSQNPNLQNIPISSERGSYIRKSFIAPNNFNLVAFDYSQIELRIASFLAEDKKMIEIFKSGEDIHSGVASHVFGVPINEVTKEMRRKAKIINFGILYGMGISALQANLKSDRKTAQEFYNKYFEKFDGLARYLEKTKEEANKTGFTKTFFGRKRYFEGINSKIPFIRASAERMAINAPIQGTSADIIKIAMKRIDDFVVSNGFEEKIFLTIQIHDELIYEVSKDLVERVVPEIKKIMQEVIKPDQIFGVPILVNVSVGNNWGEMINV